MNNTTYSVTMVFGERYTITGFPSEEEASTFAKRYRACQEAIEHDFMDLEYDGWCRSLDHDNNLIEIKQCND
jgi:hypothetical protein